MFVDVTEEKLVGGGGFLLPPILNRVKIEDAAIHFEKFSNKNINFSPQFFENGRIMSCVNLKEEQEWTNDMLFQWAQLKHAIPIWWKTLISTCSDVNEEITLF